MSRSASPAFLIGLVNYAVSRGNRVSLHSASPGPTGRNEISEGRQATVWGPAVMISGGAEAEGSECHFEIPAGVTCTHFGVWSGADFLYGAEIDPPVIMDESGTLVLVPSYREEPTNEPPST